MRQPRDGLFEESSCAPLSPMTRRPAPAYRSPDGRTPKTARCKRGWTTGACAAAAAKAACAALVTGEFPDPVEIALPGGTPRRLRAGPSRAAATARRRPAIVKDAGDDPDVTHGALVIATVRRGRAGLRHHLHARGAGVGTGHAARPADPARRARHQSGAAQDDRRRRSREVAGEDADFEVEISVPDGEKMAESTLNPRLGILGGISILGTTGIVIPYSCSSWIHSIHRGIDVARAMGFDHVSGATGNASEAAAQKLHGLHEVQLIDMGDFVGGMLKYIRDHPVPRVTIAGGVAKMTKLAQGMLDVHSKRGMADLDALAAVADRGRRIARSSRARSARANTVAEAFAAADGRGRAARRRHRRGSAWTTAAAVLEAPGHRAGNPGLRPRGRADGPSALQRRLMSASRPRKRR